MKLRGNFEPMLSVQKGQLNEISSNTLHQFSNATFGGQQSGVNLKTALRQNLDWNYEMN